jgi:hypothetical protein
VLAQPQSAQQIHTDRQTVVQVADTIARSAGLAITPSTDGPLRAWLHRYATTVRNIHWNWIWPVFRDGNEPRAAKPGEP